MQSITTSIIHNDLLKLQSGYINTALTPTLHAKQLTTTIVAKFSQIGENGNLTGAKKY